MSILLAAIITALVQILLAEVFGWCPWLAERLIRRAARQLPPDARTRYEEDWLAEFDVLPGRGISTLIFAIRILVGAPRVRKAILGSSAVTSQTYSITKRTLDVFGVASILLMLAPLLACIAVTLRLTRKRALSRRRPVFSHWPSTGRDGEYFDLIEFRTSGFMCFEDPRSGPGFVVGTTSLGGFLLQTRLQALPQLFNVLRGEMSLVGPHTRRPNFAEIHASEVPGYIAPLPVKPGFTGLAQIQGLHREVSPSERVALDNYYIAHRSLRLDLKILALSFVALFRNQK